MNGGGHYSPCSPINPDGSSPCWYHLLHHHYEESTKDYTNLTLNLAIAYGGRQEIVNAAREAVEHKMDLTEENIQKFLWVKDNPDIIIRTAEERLSNFLTWQSAYSEIYFVDKLWQEFAENDLTGIIQDYNDRERRYGK